MSDTKTNRAYGWALQTDFTTQKAIAAAAFKQLIVTDDNFIDYEAKTNNDEDWAHGVNAATDEWIEAHDANVRHTMPAFSQELGKVLQLNLGDYAITTPTGGTISKQHAFKPTNPQTTRQDKAVTYAEKLAAGWNVVMPRAVSDGFSIKGDALGVLMVDFGLLGAGLIIPNAGVTYYPTATPTVDRITGLHKLFNTQVALTVHDGVVQTGYLCRYRSFEVNFKKTMLSEAGYKPGCADFLVSGDPTSGIIRSAHEFDKQMLDFSFVVDMATNSPEFVASQNQQPMTITITATGGIIEGAIRHKLTVLIPLGKYKSSKPTIANGIASFSISGKALFDFTSGKLFEVQLINNVANYATAW